MKKKLRVLTIDDEEGIRKSLRILLEREGFIVYTAENSKTAFKQLEQYEIDVVLCDIIFENEDGAETGLKIFRYVRKEYPQVPIVMVTVKGDLDTKIKFLDEGALFFVTKPWLEEELIPTVRTVGENKRSREKIQRLRQKAIQLEKKATVRVVTETVVNDMMIPSKAIKKFQNSISVS